MNRFASASTPAGSPSHAPQPAKPVEIPHQLSVRVTTLLKPSFFASSTLAFETLPQGAAFATDAVPRIEASSGPSTRPHALNYAGVSELMQFTTGTEFYLSDTFTFYLHLSNESENILKNISTVVVIKDAQSRQQTVLDTTASPKLELKQQQHSDHIVKFHLTEPGYHVLGIQAMYAPLTGEPRTLTKHFKFMVNKPLSIESSLVTTLPTGFLVKAVVTNLTQSFPLLMEKVEFEPASIDLVSKSLSPTTPSLSQSQVITPLLETSADDLSILDLSLVSVLRPGCTMQYLFEVSYKNVEQFDPKSISTLGAAAIKWRFPMGEFCELHSAPIFVNFSSRKPFTFIVSSLPATVTVNQAFNVAFLIRNISAAPIRPRIVAVKSKMEGIILTGLSGILAPKLEPGESYTYNVKAIALEAGIQSLHGIRITELEKDKIYDLGTSLTVSAEI
jgi:hypothetical protein